MAAPHRAGGGGGRTGRAGRPPARASAVATRCWPPRSTTGSSPGGARWPVSGCCRPRSRFARRSRSAGHRGAGAGTRSRRTRSTTGSLSSTGEVEPFLDGCRRGPVWGTMWHGAYENDDFRRAWLAEIAERTGSDWRADPRAPAYGARRETMIDTLADAIEQHLDVELILGPESADERPGAGHRHRQRQPRPPHPRGDRGTQPGRRLPGRGQGRGQARSGRAPRRDLPGLHRP